MSFDPLSAAFNLGETLVNRFFPDKNKRAEEMRKLEELRQKGDLAELNAHVQLMMGQLGVNKQEAQHKSVFVAGWRPAIGWVGAISLAALYIPKALVVTAVWTYQVIMMIQATPDAEMVNFVLPPFPDLGLADIVGLLMSMLGIGAMRSYDKKQGTQTDSIK